MTEERRYRDAEIREIFDRAAEMDRPEHTPSSTGEGLTLAELQDIGREVDLPADRIARAAYALDVDAGREERETQLGMPVSVGRVVALPRAPDDREWNVLLSSLRETFRARGVTASHGNLREWTNGNLHAYVEPSDAGGYRLRMGSLKSTAAPLTVVGILSLVMGALVMLGGAATGGGWAALLGGGVIAAAGVGLLGANVLGLPRWAAEREAQMEGIAARAVALLGEDHPNPEARGS